MSEQTIEALNFKYSVRKLLIRIVIGSILLAGGLLITLYFSKLIQTRRSAELLEIIRNSSHAMPQDPAWSWFAIYIPFIIAIIGFVLASFAVFNLIKRKRVFLRLTPSGLQHNELDTFLRIPYTRETTFLWEELIKADIKCVPLFGTSIILTLRAERKSKSLTHTIHISCSEYDAEYILQII